MDCNWGNPTIRLNPPWILSRQDVIHAREEGIEGEVTKSIYNFNLQASK